MKRRGVRHSRDLLNLEWREPQEVEGEGSAECWTHEDDLQAIIVPLVGAWEGVERGKGSPAYRRGGLCYLRVASPSPEPICWQFCLLLSSVLQVFAHRTHFTSIPNHTGHGSSLSHGKNEGEIRAHIPYFFYNRKTKYFPIGTKYGYHT